MINFRDLLKNIKRKTANPIQNTSIYNDCETSPFFEKTEYDKLIEEVFGSILYTNYANWLLFKTTELFFKENPREYGREDSCFRADSKEAH